MCQESGDHERLCSITYSATGQATAGGLETRAAFVRSRNVKLVPTRPYSTYMREEEISTNHAHSEKRKLNKKLVTELDAAAAAASICIR